VAQANGLRGTKNLAEKEGTRSGVTGRQQEGKDLRGGKLAPQGNLNVATGKKAKQRGKEKISGGRQIRRTKEQRNTLRNRKSHEKITLGTGVTGKDMPKGSECFLVDDTREHSIKDKKKTSKPTERGKNRTGLGWLEEKRFCGEKRE